LHGFSRPVGLGLKCGFGEQNRARGGAILTSNELVFALKLRLVPILVKIDQEMRPWESDRRIHRYTDRQTDRQTQTGFMFLCPMLYVVAMGK